MWSNSLFPPDTVDNSHPLRRKPFVFLYISHLSLRKQTNQIKTRMAQRSVISCSREDVDRCQFTNWYPLFQKFTLRSQILLLPPEFVEWLRTGNFIVDDSLFPPNSESPIEEVEVRFILFIHTAAQF